MKKDDILAEIEKAKERAAQANAARPEPVFQTIFGERPAPAEPA